MAARKKLDINPVFNHRKSIALVDTAEELVDSLDNLSVCLKHIEEKYVQDEAGKGKIKDDKAKVEQSGSLYLKLKENLDIARDLTDTLKREKWRLGRREMSIELRMGELEDYKSHLKRDMTDMNQTVDVLSVRVVQLENALCDAQELQEATEAERKDLDQQVEDAKKTIHELETKQTKLLNEIKSLKGERKDTVLRQHSRELNDKMEILVLENKSLKELIRERDEVELSTNDACNVSNNDTRNGETNDTFNDSKNDTSGGANKSDNICEGVPEDSTVTSHRQQEEGGIQASSTTITETSTIAYV